MDEPPPTASTASKTVPCDWASRAKAIATAIDSSVGSTLTPSNTTTSRPRARHWSAIRSG